MAEEVKEEVKVEKPKRATTARTEKKTDRKPETKKFVKREVQEEVKPAKRLHVKPVNYAKPVTKISTGRRKDAVARVRLVEGNGKITINGRDIDEYFMLDTLKLIVRQPLKLTNTENKYDVIVNVYGGGYTGQTGAIRHGISRALVKENEIYKAELKKAGFLSRDSRMKERKKYGLKKARKAPQFSKR